MSAWEDSAAAHLENLSRSGTTSRILQYVVRMAFCFSLSLSYMIDVSASVSPSRRSVQMSGTHFEYIAGSLLSSSSNSKPPRNAACMLVNGPMHRGIARAERRRDCISDLVLWKGETVIRANG